MRVNQMMEQQKKFFIQNIIEEVNLNVFPQAASQILDLLNDENVSILQLAKVASQDPYIVATLIKLANSPFYGLKNKITNIVHAISLIGLEETKRLIFTISAKSIFRDYDIFDKLLWEHSIAVATISQTLSFKYNLFNESMSYIAGLLHDVGKIIMYKSKQINYKSIIEQVNSNDNMLSVDIEMEVYGFNHCDVGKEILTTWRFDNLITQSVYLHHSDKFLEDEANKLAAIINFSDYIANWLSIGRFKPYRKNYITDLESFKFLNVSIDNVEVFLQEIEKRVNLSKEII